MSYRKHAVCKGTRAAHHRRERARRRKLREKGGQVEPFGYADIRGRDKRALRQMSVSKGQRDGAPKLMVNPDVTKVGQAAPKNGRAAIAAGTRRAETSETSARAEGCQSGGEAASPNLSPLHQGGNS